MKRTVQDVFKPGQKIFFRSGNQVGRYAKVLSVDSPSDDYRAIFGFLIHIEYENGEVGVVEKTEHVQKVK